MRARIKSFLEYCQRVWGLEPPRWHYLQVEVTTRCNLPGCIMCPRTAWPSIWQARDLAWDTFEALIPSLKFFSHVHLSGWGEPLLHPRIWDMVRVLQARGLKVGLTTNGLGLNEEVQMQVLEHLDVVAISLDGARAETHEKVRPGANFNQVVQQVADLCSRKRSRGLKRPEIALLFLKMRPNLDELPEFLRLAASLKVDRVNAPNLDFIPISEMAPLSPLTLGPPDPKIQALQREAEAEARTLKIPFRNFSLHPQFDLRVCDANPLQNAFVTVSGEVAPCVYLGLPVNGPFTRQYFGKSYQTRNFSYGNVRDCGLARVLQQPAYLNFIDYFKGPSQIFAILQPLRDEDKTSTELKRSRQAPAISGHWPPSCQGCLKCLGF
jgi:MoaA/NifB/PqqE/SkfB family radical SAM enzyme